MPGLPLAVSGLTLAYGGDTIVTLADLQVAPGTLVVLAGPSGSGKSTLLYLLSGLLAPDAGRIDWSGVDLAPQGEGQRDQWRRRHAGFIFQDFHLVGELSPLDNVLVPALFENFSVERFRDAAMALLGRLNVPQDRKRASLLSRGEQQRVAIARALLFDPPVIFADEPTASLDADTGRDVIAILRDLASVEGRTVLVATHDPALLEKADLVVRLAHGKPLELET